MDRRAGRSEYTAAELGAIAHLYRAEVFRSTNWRSRLDNTTNWAVVTLGLALSLTFASEEATALPLILVGLLAMLFLGLEARRYRYFNVWRARARLMETDFYAPMLRGQGGMRDGCWDALLAEDLLQPRFHISYARAVGRRLRRNYAWIFLIQIVTYTAKIAVHPTPLSGLSDVLERAAIGPVPGWAVLAGGALFHASWMTLGLATWLVERRVRRERKTLITIA
jgi:uncharacterized membrane protein